MSGAPPADGQPAELAVRAGAVEVDFNDTELHRRLLETAPDAIVVIDAAGRIVFANRQTELMFEYSGSALIVQSIELLVPERLRAGHRGHREHYAREPSARPMVMRSPASGIDCPVRAFGISM